MRGAIVAAVAVLHCGSGQDGAASPCPPTPSVYNDENEPQTGPYDLSGPEAIDLLRTANIIERVGKGLRGSPCVNTERCFLHGECGLPDGSCGVYADVDCLYSRRCYRDGLCARRVGEDGVASCWGRVRSFIEVGLLGTEPDHHFDAFDLTSCSNEAGSCPARGPLTCRHSPWCIKYGKCYYTEGKCHAKTDFACKFSVGCKESGNCSFDGTVCAPSQ
jgi:hypothetical protein